MAELVDALDSKSSSFGSAGSIPAPGTFFNYEVALRSIFSVSNNDVIRGAYHVPFRAVCDSLYHGF